MLDISKLINISQFPLVSGLALAESIAPTNAPILFCAPAYAYSFAKRVAGI